MPCVTPPPFVVEATFTVSASQLHPKQFHARGRSAHYIDRAGGLHFSCFAHPIIVVLTLKTPGLYFYGQHNESVSFVDDAIHHRKDQAPLAKRGNHQFPGGIQHIGRKTIWFVYRNDWDCGHNDGSNGCPVSAYGLYLVNNQGVVHHYDPIIDNGGTQY
jgi:hypothetical protein